MRFWMRLTFVALSLLFTNPAYAAVETLIINDASQVKFVANSGSGREIYFRNLDSFAPGWLGCCYYYYIDISTEGGRAQYAAFLSAYYTKSKIMFYADKNGGALLHVGNW